MSSRALRKLQREQELQRQVEQAKKEYEQQEDDDEEDENDGDDENTHHQAAQTSKIRNAFDMLDDIQDDDSSDHEDSEPLPPQPSTKQSLSDEESKPTPRPKPKKKKKKSKKKAKGNATEPDPQHHQSDDEIDRALRELNAKSPSRSTQPLEQVEDQTWDMRATQFLGIEEKNLNPLNEMKSLFGNIALEGEGPRTQTRNPRRRELNQQGGGVDLATALTGRYSHASRGRELGALASRRNIFIQGREEWPLATSGGLSMDLSDQSKAPVKRYNIMHNQLYRETQMHFRMAVESMDPQRMIGLLSMYPYHIATLLQVSEIAKHQGDHSVSGDLLERALYTFGKSVHSSFPAAVRTGNARLGFSKPANRELYLAIWRYIKNLEMRGTWRTAFEWSKILLQFEPVNDPFGVTLMIDQLALRGRQHSKFIELCWNDAFGSAWSHLPNIQISLALAHLRDGKPREARQQLASAIHRCPYILSALASALDISPLPKSLWAKLPSTDAEKLYTQLYLTRAKDLWTTPEATSLLVEVAETLGHYPQSPSTPPTPKLEISLEEARHIMLLEIPHLIALLPRRFTNMPTSSSDVLPPPDSESDFVRRAPAGQNPALLNTPMQTIFNAAGATAGATGTILQRIMNWFGQPAGTGQDESEGQAALRQLQEELGGNVPPEMIEQLLQIHLDEAHGEDNEIDPAGLGMGVPGAWGEDEEAEDAEDGDSMPELEGHWSLPRTPDTDTPVSPIDFPRAATVEDDDEDEDDEGGNGGSRSNAAAQSRQTTDQISLGNAVLRRVDSDESLDSDHRRPITATQQNTIPSHTTVNTTQPNPTSVPTPTTQPSQASSTAAAANDQFADPQRLQRWLLTTGLSELQADSSVSTLNTYVTRLRTLRKAQQDWIVNMVRQRAGVAMEERVRSAL
ncbi:hypothetical protein B0A52_05541 [Exophiala mesophila]|uniref:Transcription factor 25 n=1 Tax=Exophiala mesophila TaxID=212818 RepID=A0A438N3G0_EXOME|nr:hypothetical protein B0A52_05541 [Exophiala mesophila]